MNARVEMFGVPMDAMTMDDTVREIGRRGACSGFTQHVVVNVAKVVQMQDDPALSSAVRSCDIINIDGAGIVFAGRFLGMDIPERVAGIDLFHKLLEHAQQAGLSVFLLGATAEVLEQAVGNLRGVYPRLRIAGYHHGYFWKEEQQMVERIRASGADMLFVGIGSPMKERFIDRWRDVLGVRFAMGVGGTFDVVAGKVRRAPLWMQRAGLEWFFRVLQEPGRMWRRYLVTNCRFLVMVVRAKFGRSGVHGRTDP